jgi:hypothetical protein
MGVFMSTQEHKEGLLQAAKEFNIHFNRNDGERVAVSLDAGLELLGDLLYLRLHSDVEKSIGTDSMTIPVSETKTREQINTEIEIYQIAESQAAVQDFVSHGHYDQWYWQWLTRLRLNASPVEINAEERIADYISKTPHSRELAFTNILVKRLPEANRAPLVLFQLFPLAVHIATVLAFDDRRTAAKLRDQQAIYLPAIGDCNQCHGKLLTNGDKCPKCGNPLWTYEWLAAD